MSEKVKQLDPAQALALIEEIRSSCASAVKEESSADAGDFTIEALEQFIGKDWARTKVVISVPPSRTRTLLEGK